MSKNNHKTYYLVDIAYIERDTKDMYGDMSYTFGYMDETRCDSLQFAIQAIRDTAQDTIADYNSWEEDNQMYINFIDEYKWNNNTNEYDRHTVHTIAFCPDGLEVAKALYPDVDEVVWE